MQARARVGPRARRGALGAADGRIAAGRRRGLLPRHGRCRRADAGRGQGPQFLDRLERRQRSLLGHDLAQEQRHARFPEDVVVASRLERAAATIAGTTWAWSTSPASTKRPGPIQRASACGWITGAPIVRPIRSRTRRSIRVWRWARAARTCRSGRSTARRRASSACASSRTRTSTRRRPRSGTPNASTKTRATTCRRIW